MINYIQLFQLFQLFQLTLRMTYSARSYYQGIYNYLLGKNTPIIIIYLFIRQKAPVLFTIY